MAQAKKRQTTGEIPLHSTRCDGAHHSSAWNSVWRQFMRFCLVGGANTVIDLLIFNLLLWSFPTRSALELVAFNSVAYTSGALSSFFLNKYWTFRRGQKPTWRELLRFGISLFCEVLYSNGLVWLAGRALRPLIADVTLWANASKLIALAVGALISFSLMRFWTFAGEPRKREDDM